MPLFLARHAGDDPAIGMTIAHHRQLAGIDARRAELAGLIDAQHRRAVPIRQALGRARIFGACAHAFLAFSSNAKMASAAALDKRPL